MLNLKETINKHAAQLQKEVGVSNTLAVPRLTKAVISAGIGSIQDKRKRELIYERVGLIAGQKPVWAPAKKSIANFKVRKGDPSGVKVTLRGQAMCDFVEKLIHVAIPRMRDFKGLEPTSVDQMGNLTIGIPEHTIFPETADEDLRDVFGLAVTITTTASDRKTALAAFRAMGLPIKKEEKE